MQQHFTATYSGKVSSQPQSLDKTGGVVEPLRLKHQAPGQYVLNLFSHSGAFVAGSGTAAIAYASNHTGSLMQSFADGMRQAICDVVDTSDPTLLLCNMTRIPEVINNVTGVAIESARETGLLHIMIPAAVAMGLSYMVWHRYNYTAPIFASDGNVHLVNSSSSNEDIQINQS